MRTAPRSTRCSPSSTRTSARRVRRMRDDDSLRRLAEIGIDVYVPRAAQARADVASATSSAPRPGAGARVVLLARAGDARHALVADVRRALAFARIEATVG